MDLAQDHSNSNPSAVNLIFPSQLVIVNTEKNKNCFGHSTRRTVICKVFST